MDVIFDKNKMLRMINLDPFLSFIWKGYKNDAEKQDNPSAYLDSMMEAMFNTFVLGDSVAERKYNNNISVPILS